MTSQFERDVEEQVKRLEEKLDLSTRLTAVEHDLAATNAAITVAFKAKKEHDDQNNEVRQSLEKALNQCITESEYNRRHDQLDQRITETRNTQDIKITEIRDRLIALESKGLGASGAQAQSRENSTLRVVVIGLVCAVCTLLAGVIFSVLMYFKH